MQLVRDRSPFGFGGVALAESDRAARVGWAAAACVHNASSEVERQEDHI